MVEQCQVCAKFRVSNQNEPLQNYKITKFPWQQVGIDFLYFENSNYLIVTDYYSKYIEIALMDKGYSAKNVIIHLKSIFARHGIPMSLVSDGGPPFLSLEFKSFLYDWDIEHVVSSPYHSQSNGQAESSVKIIKNILKKCKETNTDPYIALLQYRNTPKNNLPSPAQLLMSRNLRMNIPVTQNRLKPKVVKFSHYKECFQKRNTHDAKYYNSKTKPLPLLQIGDHVYFKKIPNGNWLPAIVKEKLNCQRSYIIEANDGIRYRRNRVHLKFRFHSNVYCHDPLPMRTSSLEGTEREGIEDDGQVEEVKAKGSEPYMTRSGRVVNPPVVT
ncbi:hypothetical protein JYU34_022487 [Plutella xylostella]|uniref:Integrase catalytic domain-containing protein n=1 Tax=Plutella xylostella TaxID=51655 RepID=A0ABQ7PUT6_PLUXY|nr:hypothetical protein JYU34_022487 [Plutella xylostella]